MSSLRGYPTTRHVTVLLLGRIALLPFAFVSLPAAALLLPQVELGKLALLMALQSGLNLLLIGPPASYVFRRVNDWREHGVLVHRLRVFWGYVALVAAAVGGATALVINLWDASLGLPKGWFVAMLSGYLLVHIPFAILANGLNLLGHRSLYVVLSVAGAWLGVAGSVLLAWTLGATAYWWISGQLVAEAALAVGAWLFVARLYRSHAPLPGISWRAGLAAAEFAWPLALGTALYWVQSQAFPFLLLPAFGAAFIGALSVTLGLGIRVMASFERVFVDFYLPGYYAELVSPKPEDRIAAWDRYSRTLYSTLVVATVFAAFAGPWLVRLLFTNAYHGFAWLAAWGAVSEGLRIAFSGFSTAFQGHLRTRPLLLPQAVGAVVVLLLVQIATSGQGDPALGTAVALTAGSAAAASIGLAAAFKLLGLRPPLHGLALGALYAAPIVVIFVVGDAFASSAPATALLVLALGALWVMIALTLLAPMRRTALPLTHGEGD
jgi:O-antigen/teichoic acid export membrane protein